MTGYDYALLLHLVAVVAFFSGLAVAAAAMGAAWRRENARELAALLGVARTGVVLVGAGTALVLGSGLWLIEETGHSLGDGWLLASLGLLVLAALAGAVGGRKPKQARLLAEQQGEAPVVDPAVHALLRNRVALAANLLSAVASGLILLLMVWRPG